MASTYSPSLKLELMATGDQTGTWGVTNNTNLGTLLEQAITGVLSVAQGDVANLTLTSLDGASDQARNAVVNLTGAMTANRNVVVPTANKVYLVKNSTTGGFAVTVKTAAGSGVSIASGTAQWVYCDGTNVVQGLSGTLAAQAAAAVAITGGTITGLTSLGSSGVALTSGTVTGLTSLTLASGAATPATNDAAALGTSTLMWSDLFLASGGVINFNNGNYTLTHSAGVLTANGAFSIGTGNALTAGTIELGAATDTTISRGAAGFIAVEGNRVPSPASQASGDILYRGATEWERLAKGTAAQVLTMNAGATAPEWAAASGGVTLLAAVATTSGTGTTGKSLSFPTGTKKITFMCNGISSSSAANAYIRLGDAGGAESSGYTNQGIAYTGSASLYAESTSQFPIGAVSSAGALLTSTIELTLMDSSSRTWQVTVASSQNNTYSYYTSGSKALSAELTTVTVYFDAGNFDAGSISALYSV